MPQMQCTCMESRFIVFLLILIHVLLSQSGHSVPALFINNAIIFLIYVFVRFFACNIFELKGRLFPVIFEEHC